MANGGAQPTLWLNDVNLSQNASLLSRCHAEIGWERRAGRENLVLYDGDPDNCKPSLNGTAVNDTLVPLGGAMVVHNGMRINFGAPHILSATRKAIASCGGGTASAGSAATVGHH